MQLFGNFAISMAVAGLMIVFFSIAMLINLYLALGTIFPELSITIDQKIGKALNKPPVIILDPSYVRKRNVKWFIWVLVSTHVAVLAFMLFLKSIK